MSKKKITVLIALILMLIIAGVGMILRENAENAPPPEFIASYVYDFEVDHPSYIFYTPEYDADISKDEDYKKQVPYVYYTSNGLTECITEENYSEYGPLVEFFGKYFDALKSGDTDTYISLHSDRFFKNNFKPYQIAPQRLYNINIELIATANTSDPEYGEVEKAIVKTTYMIMKNDGTFRSDIGSDSSRAQYLEVVYDNNGIFIDAAGYSFKYPGE
ncbi:MAG: hypothetical protein IKL09_01025 [Clostridia bacterium]|nr:hypothetical protein [Clostridia bacterium]